jgi:thiosulfate reductase cytochrome b subunit
MVYFACKRLLQPIPLAYCQCERQIWKVVMQEPGNGHSRINSIEGLTYTSILYGVAPTDVTRLTREMLAILKEIVVLLEHPVHE